MTKSDKEYHTADPIMRAYNASNSRNRRLSKTQRNFVKAYHAFYTDREMKEDVVVERFANRLNWTQEKARKFLSDVQKKGAYVYSPRRVELPAVNEMARKINNGISFGEVARQYGLGEDNVRAAYENRRTAKAGYVLKRDNLPGPRMADHPESAVPAPAPSSGVPSFLGGGSEDPTIVLPGEPEPSAPGQESPAAGTGLEAVAEEALRQGNIDGIVADGDLESKTGSGSAAGAPKPDSNPELKEEPSVWRRAINYAAGSKIVKYTAAGVGLAVAVLAINGLGNGQNHANNTKEVSKQDYAPVSYVDQAIKDVSEKNEQGRRDVLGRIDRVDSAVVKTEDSIRGLEGKLDNNQKAVERVANSVDNLRDELKANANRNNQSESESKAAEEARVKAAAALRELEMAEAARKAEADRITEAKRLADENERIAEAKRLADEKAEAERIAEAKRLADEKAESERLRLAESNKATAFGKRATGGLEARFGANAGEVKGQEARVKFDLGYGNFKLGADLLYDGVRSELASGEDFERDLYGFALQGGFSRLRLRMNSGGVTENTSGSSSNTTDHNEAVFFRQTENDSWEQDYAKLVNSIRADSRLGKLDLFLQYAHDVAKTRGKNNNAVDVVFPLNPGFAPVHVSSNVRSRTSVVEDSLIVGGSYDEGFAGLGALFRAKGISLDSNASLNGTRTIDEEEKMRVYTAGISLGARYEDMILGNALGLWNFGDVHNSDIESSQIFEGAANAIARLGNNFALGAGIARESGEKKGRGLVFIGDAKKNLGALSEFLSAVEKDGLFKEGRLDEQGAWQIHDRFSSLGMDGLALFGEIDEDYKKGKVGITAPLLLLDNTSLTGWFEGNKQDGKIRIEPKILLGDRLSVSPFWANEFKKGEGNSNELGANVSVKF